jgi:hypothetical protein
MDWIEDIVENTPTFSFLSHSRINMVGFVNLHKVVFKRSVFSALSSV